MGAPVIAPIADAIVASALAASERLVAQATAHGLAFALDQLGDIDIPEPEMRADRQGPAARFGDPLPRRRPRARRHHPGGRGTRGPRRDRRDQPRPRRGRGRCSPTGGATATTGSARPSATPSSRACSAPRQDRSPPTPAATPSSRTACSICARRSTSSTRWPRAIPMAARRSRRGSGRRREAWSRISVEAGGGITAFMATEVIDTLKQAFAILGHPALRGIFAARDVWGVVGGIGRLSRQRFRPGRPLCPPRQGRHDRDRLARRCQRPARTASAVRSSPSAIPWSARRSTGSRRPSTSAKRWRPSLCRAARGPPKPRPGRPWDPEMATAALSPPALRPSPRGPVPRSDVAPGPARPARQPAGLLRAERRHPPRSGRLAGAGSARRRSTIRR